MCEILQPIKDELLEIENENSSKFEATDSYYKAAEPTLCNMPVEIILRICAFLDAKFLRDTLSKVCKRFAIILEDQHIWRYWVQSKTCATFPAIPNLKVYDNNEIDWETICVDMDNERYKWSNRKETMKHIISTKDAHFASVDTVLLINNGEICISGGRDRGMALWNVLQIKSSDEVDNTDTITYARPIHTKPDAHAGWIWDMATDNYSSTSTIYSASWDNTVKAWDLNNGFNCTQTFMCGISALSIVTSDNLIIAGLYSKSIVSFDPRVGTHPVKRYIAHKGPVLNLELFNNKVASVSEDRTVAIWDLIADKLIVNEVEMPYARKAYPVRISWSQSALYISDSKGTLHLFNPETFTHVSSHSIWPEPPHTKACSKITGCYQSQGTMIICSDQGEIKFCYNCYPPLEHSEMITNTAEITQLRYLNGVLAVGTCDSSIEMWVPIEMYEQLSH